MDAVYGRSSNAACVDPGTIMAGEPVLIVDDHPINVKVLRLTLEVAGYTVRTAGSADQATAVMASFRPRLILMDIQLPGVDGLELTRRFKADPETRACVIIAVTAYAMKGDARRALDAGCAGYITKPVDTRTFAGLVAAYLGGRNDACLSGSGAALAP